MRNNNDKEFSQIKIKPQTIDTGIYRPLKMINDKKKKKIPKKPDGDNKQLTYRGTNTRISFGISSENLYKKRVY